MHPASSAAFFVLRTVVFFSENLHAAEDLHPTMSSAYLLAPVGQEEAEQLAMGVLLSKPNTEKVFDEDTTGPIKYAACSMQASLAFIVPVRMLCRFFVILRLSHG
jgi:hypothetical protein